MVTVQHLVKRELEKNPFLIDILQQELVNVSALAPAAGSQTVNFQAFILADYMVGADTFTKSGFSQVLPITVSPSAGIAVTITYS